MEENRTKAKKFLNIKKDLHLKYTNNEQGSACNNEFNVEYKSFCEIHSKKKLAFLSFVSIKVQTLSQKLIIPIDFFTQ